MESIFAGPLRTEQLANVIYASEVARRYPQWTTVSLHPGTVKTELHQHGDGEGLVLRIFQKVLLAFASVPVENGVHNYGLPRQRE